MTTFINGTGSVKMNVTLQMEDLYKKTAINLAESVTESAGHLSGGVGSAMGHILEEAAQVALADQPRESLRHIVEEAQRVTQEVRGAQDQYSLLMYKSA
jgi:ABC-type branched-subunit amino acid transport system ATPase component